mgnify:CR=1 FL=1
MGAFPKSFRMAYGHSVGWKCEDCGRAWKDGWMLEFHHIIPTSAGGKDTSDNCRLCCRTCHLKAHKRLRARNLDDPRSVGLIERRIAKEGLRRRGF